MGQRPLALGLGESATVSEIVARYRHAGFTADEDGYFFDPDFRSWERIPELVEIGYFGTTQLVMSI